MGFKDSSQKIHIFTIILLWVLNVVFGSVISSVEKKVQPEEKDWILNNSGVVLSMGSIKAT